MLDLSKYEGHTQGRDYLNLRNGCPIYVYLNREGSDAALIADAPLLLAEVKALRESHAKLRELAQVALDYFTNRHGSCGCYQAVCKACQPWRDRRDRATEVIKQAKAL